MEENLNFFASVFNTTIEENYHLIKGIYSHIAPFKDRKAGKLSGGMKVKAAPIHVTKSHLARGKVRAIIANSGNANACAPQGEENAEKMCAAAAKAIGCTPEEVLVSSTGVIGQTLKVDVIENGVPELYGGGVSVHADAVESGPDHFLQGLLEHFLGNGAVGGKEAEHGAHVGMDHAAALGDAADMDLLAADDDLPGEFLLHRVGGHDGVGRAVAALRAVLQQAVQLRHAVFDHVHLQRLADHSGPLSTASAWTETPPPTTPAAS